MGKQMNIKPDVHARLTEYKNANKHKTFSDAIAALLPEATPISVSLDEACSPPGP